ncbi:unnamed protein product [Rotaria sordida]|uniref:Uncharacterized protein n=1 Tax=Rotaria sordida TaxID=392033 RepID=A0A818YDY3_9BILA|nr:unnamed protein product [Rotaria sordida]CAF1192446.1 unnamed protein product [Rotaria sordida]CAF1281903.1 unnamed protein product [Rotaria sordida]CAF1299419.1 unnamed protein product [Rotaria sordida]CAF1462788.1 unnamed protein product [Rotaria sordida]
MSKYFLLSFGLISFLFLASFISCSPIFHRNDISNYFNDQYSDMIDIDEENIEGILSPKFLSFNRYQRSPLYYPRTNRNAWFRVSTYQHFKPSKLEEQHNGDHVMRWG